MPEMGNEPYIFISYAHLDSDKVLPIIHRLEDDGYRVWYGEKIHQANWGVNVADALEGAVCVILFNSNNSLRSNNVYHEICFATNVSKPILCYDLEDIDEDKYNKDPNGHWAHHWKLMLMPQQHFRAYSDGEDRAYARLKQCLPDYCVKKDAFIAYAHKDGEIVLPIIHRLEDDGYRVWYDEKIHQANWGVNVADALKGANTVILFKSNNSLKSDNVYQEICMASNNEKPIFCYCLTEVDYGSVPNERGSHWEMMLIPQQHFYAYRDGEDEAYKGLKQCLSDYCKKNDGEDAEYKDLKESTERRADKRNGILRLFQIFEKKKNKK